MPDDLPVYEITAILDTEGADDRHSTGELTLTYVNTTGESLDMLPFRLFANGPSEDHDAVTVEDVTVDGDPVEPELSVLDSVLEVPLDGGLDEGDDVEIAMSFTTTIPIDETQHYGIFNADSETGTLALAHWFPTIAGRDPVTGWVLDPPSVNGDPIFSDTALFDVTITAGEDWRIVTTGVPFDDADRDDDLVTQRYVSGPARDFTIVADDDFEVVERRPTGSRFRRGTTRARRRPGKRLPITPPRRSTSSTTCSARIPTPRSMSCRSTCTALLAASSRN